MAAEWFYAKSKQKVGPVTLEQLKELVRSGELGPADMVWRQGMAKWTQANQVEGLFQAGPSQAVPPPLPPTPPPLPEAEWHFIKDGQQQGPVTADQLRAKAASSDLVWRAGIPQWVAGCTIAGLFPGASPRQPVPPPPPKPADPSCQSSVSAADRALDHFNRGIDLHKQGAYARALAEFAEAYRLDPGDSDYRMNLAVSHYNRGLDHTEQGDSARALADFTEAFRLDPANDDYRNTLAVAHFNRGIDYTKQGDSARALAAFTEACRLDSTNADYRHNLAASHYNRGIDYTEQGDSARAMTAFREAFRLDPTNADYRHNVAATHHSLGVTYFTNKDYANAKAEFQEAVRLDPADKKYQECLATTTHNLHLSGPGPLPATDVPFTNSDSEGTPNATLDLMPYAAFLTQRPVTPVFINADCKLKHLSPLLWQSAGSYSGCSETHFCVAVGDLGRWKICMETAFVEKRSDAGKEIHGVLKDGHEHKLILQVAFQGPNEEPASEYEEFSIVGTQEHPFTPSESGISDLTVAKQVAQKKAAAQWHAVPVEQKSLSDLQGDEEHFLVGGEEVSIRDATPEQTMYGGDGPCPKCKTLIWVDWKNTYVTMKCPKCAYCFDLKEAIAFLSAYKPEDSYKPERANALLAGQQQPPSSVGASATPAVKKREPGIWHRLKSAMSPNTNRCPQCGENLAGEDEGTELIDREEGIQTRMKIDETYHSSGERSSTQRQVQVTVYHDTYWQYLKCKFCDHEWREKRETTYQP